jgi:hypothetical protein
MWIRICNTDKNIHQGVNYLSLKLLKHSLCLTGEQVALRATETKVKKFKAELDTIHHAGTIV